MKLACRFALEAVRILQGREQQEIPIGEDASYEQLKGLVRGTIDEISKIDARAIEQAREQYINQIATLLGKTPAELNGLFAPHHYPGGCGFLALF